MTKSFPASNGMNKKEFQKLLRDQADATEKRIKIHIGVLVEDFDSKVALISEQHSSIMRVLEEHTRQIKAIERSLIRIDIRLNKLEDDSAETNRRLARIEDRLGRVENSLKGVVNYEEFQELVKRVTLLESRLGRKA